jgi:hypothetical protein
MTLALSRAPNQPYRKAAGSHCRTFTRALRTASANPEHPTRPLACGSSFSRPLLRARGSEIHSDADRRREVHAVEIAARHTAGDLRPQEAAVSLDALGRTITDHRGERVESAAAA